MTPDTHHHRYSAFPSFRVRNHAIVEEQPDGTWRARLPWLRDFAVLGATKEEAEDRLVPEVLEAIRKSHHLFDLFLNYVRKHPDPTG